MIRILIIEDLPEKLRRILTFLKDECSIQEANIDCAANVKEGREFLYSNNYDLLLLDLVLPFNDDDEPSAEAGAKFLDEIHYNPNINIPIHIIGLTAVETAFNDSSQEFEDKLWSLVNFQLNNTDWTEKLKSKIFYLQTFKKNYKEFIESERRFDVVIITALNKEFAQLKNICDWKSMSIPDDQLLYFKTTLNTRNSNNLKIITCCINDMGMQSAAAVASKVISLFSPKYLFMTGICAGIKSEGINIGDVIIAKQVWDYESGKISEDSSGNLNFKPDMKCLPTDQGIVSRLTEFSNNATVLSAIYNEFNGNKPNTQLNIKIDSVGSGPYLLSSKNYLGKLLGTDRKLIGIDMEGYGIYKATEFHKDTIAVLVKGVSDYGDADKDDNYQNYASYASARFVIEFLKFTF